MQDQQSGFVEVDWTDKMMQLSDRAKHTFWGKLGCELVQVTSKKAVISLEATQDHLNMLGIVHGGVYMSLMDNAMGLVVMCNDGSEQTVTSTMNTHFLASGKEGKLLCTATLIHRTKRSVTLQATVEDEDQRMLAYSSGLYRIISS